MLDDFIFTEYSTSTQVHTLYTLASRTTQHVSRSTLAATATRTANIGIPSAPQVVPEARVETTGMPAATYGDVDTFFLPPLDRCFSRDALLISWRTALEALTSIQDEHYHQNLLAFLSEDLSIKALAACYEPSKPGNGQTKAVFETRTAAINVTPSTNSEYNISQIKDDVRWLANGASIDEITALRVAVLEWQSRPAARILDGRNKEDVVSLDQPLGASASFGASTSTRLATHGRATNSDANLEGVDQSLRRSRLLRLLYDEQEALLGVAALLEAARTCQALDSAMALTKKGTTGIQTKREASLSEIANKVSSTRIGQLNAGMGSGHALLQLFEGCEKYLQIMSEEPEPALFEDLELSLEAELPQHRVQELVHLLRLAFVATRASSHLTSLAAITAWFRIMDNTAFFQGLGVIPAINTHLSDLCQTIASLICFSLLDCTNVTQSDLLQPAGTATAEWYGADKNCSIQICHTLVNAASNGVNTSAPALLAWSIIASDWRRKVAPNRRASADEDSSVTFEQNWPSGLDVILDLELTFESTEKLTSNPDSILWFAQKAIDGLGLFSTVAGLASVAQDIFGSLVSPTWCLAVRRLLLDILRQGCTASQYSTESLEAAFVILQPMTIARHSTPSTSRAVDTIIQNEFIADELLRSTLLQQALARYPFETTPLLNLCRSLGSSTIVDEDGVPVLTQALRAATHFTQILPHGYSHYELLREDDTANSLRLTRDLPLIANASSRYQSASEVSDNRLVTRSGDGVVSIPRGTEGNALTESRPPVVMWVYEHSILAYLAASLATTLKGRRVVMHGARMALSADVRADIIQTFTSQIELLKRAKDRKGANAHKYQLARQILEETSDRLERDQDVISVIADVLEQELPSQAQSHDEASTEVMAACVQFLTATLPAIPGRIWPILARNSLLGMNGTAGKIGLVVSTLEMPIGCFDFLESCLNLYEALVTDVVSNAVARIIHSSTVAGRFEDNPSFDTKLPKQSMATLLYDFTTLFCDVLRSSSAWKFAQESQRSNINIHIMTVFDRIIHYVYGIDDSREPAAKLTGVLAQAAELISSTFLGASSNSATIMAIMRQCEQLAGTDGDVVTAHQKSLVQLEASASLKLLSSLLLIGNVSGKSSTQLQRHMFQSMPTFLRLYAFKYRTRSDVANLLARLVRIAGTDAEFSGSEPPSIFGQVGTSVAEDAIALFGDLGKPLNDAETRVAVWDFLGAVIGNRQQWLTAYLLTGSGPQRTIKKADADSGGRYRRKSVLECALDRLLELKDLDTREANALLQVVLNAINHWPWSVGRVQTHKDFLYKMAHHTIELSPTPKTKHADDALRLAYRTRSISLLTDIFAMYLYTTRQLGDSSFRKHLSESICFFKNSCVEDPAYSQSLHTRLKQNFETKFFGCRLQSFKRTSPGSTFGQEYYYDLDFANEALDSHPSWRGGTKQVGFEAEFRRANVNYSLVEVQVQLISSWRTLAIEFSAAAEGDQDVQKKLAYVAHECLAANRNSNLQAEVFEQLRTTRLELAMPVIQRLTDLKVQAGPMQSLLPEVWKTITQSSIDFDGAFGESAAYYRILLRLLLLSLSPHVYTPTTDQSSNAAQIGNMSLAIETLGDNERSEMLLEITRDVVSAGFRSLAAQLHDTPDAVLPSDFGLTSAIFHTLLRVHVKDPTMLHNRIAALLVQQNLARYATALFSWSDRLTVGTGPDADPIYGDLSISLLTDMSTIPSLANALAASGLLSQLNVTNLMGYYRRAGGVGPTDFPPRVHKIWAKGILPLSLNLALAAGDGFVPEVATFLNNFAPQLERAATGLDAKAMPTPANPAAGTVTLNIACEAHTLALLCVGLERARDGGGADQVPQLLGWDKVAMREELEAWVGMGQSAFGDRVVPASESEVRMVKETLETGMGIENRLQEMVLGELRGALFVLGGGA